MCSSGPSGRGHSNPQLAFTVHCQSGSEVQKAGYSGAEARRWAAYKNVGAILESGSSSGSNNPSPPARGTDSVAGSVLFSGADSGECQHFDTSRYKDAPEHLYSLRQLEGKYAEYAEKISILDSAEQKSVLESLRVLFCSACSSPLFRLGSGRSSFIQSMI